MENLQLIIPELFISIMIMFLLIFGVFKKNSSQLVYNLTTVSLVAALALIINLDAQIQSSLFNNSYNIDSLARFMKILLILSGIFVMLSSSKYIQISKISKIEYPILILCSILGMMVMISANDLIVFYMGLELQSLALYVLASFNRDNLLSTESGLKYFVLSALSSGLLLYGCSLIYGFSETTNFNQIMVNTKEIEYGLTFGIVFILVGLAFKISAVPFHMWAPDVYQGAPTSVTAFFAICPKLAILGLFAKILLFTFYDLLNSWQAVLLLCSLASMCVGAFGALGQSDIKRLLAYSSIGHIGYLLIGLACGTVDGLQSMLVYMVIYMTMSLTTFGVVLSIRTTNGKPVQNIQDLSGLATSNPALAITLSLTMFSMAGIPPLAGFMSKFYLFFAALSASLYPLAVVGVLTSVISSFYYIRFIKIMYFDKSEQALQFESLDASKAWVISTTMAVTVFLAAYPAPIFLMTEKLALGFCI